MTMASTRPSAERRNRRRDFHAERVRQRMVSRAILLAVFFLVGTAMALVAISLFER